MSSKSERDWHQELRAIYAEAPSKFIQLRNELAQRLKADGDADASAQVKKLPKPVATAWATNQLVHGRSDDLEELRTLTRQSAGARDVAERRELAESKRVLTQALVEAAEEHLRETGGAPTRATAQRIHRNVEALAASTTSLGGGPEGLLDDDAPPGYWHEDAEPAGGLDLLAALGASTGLKAVPSSNPGKAAKTAKTAKTAGPKSVAAKKAAKVAPSAKPSAGKRQIDAAKRKLEAASEQREEAKRELRDLTQLVARLERKLDRSQATVEKARARLEEAETALEDVEEELSSSRKQLDATQKTADQSRFAEAAAKKRLADLRGG